MAAVATSSAGRPARLVAHHGVGLALHQLTDDGQGPTALCLHGLAARSPAIAPEFLQAWPGPLLALDFSGHGDSGVPVGGGYTAEALVADVDAVCSQIGEVVLIGSGLGAYVALLFAGARPELVRGALLLDGPGLVGGGPDHQPAVCLVGSDPARPPTPDPLALEELSRETRDPAYAVAMARSFVDHESRRPPPLVAAIGRPTWLGAVLARGLAQIESLETAVRVLGALGRQQGEHK